MNDSQQKCLREKLGHLICETVEGLSPLYCEACEDRADSVLGAHPDTANIIEAHRTLIDVMLPGRMSTGSIDSEELSVFLMKRLSQAYHLLRPEIESAVSFRWLGQAARVEGAPAPVDAKAESFRVLREFYAEFPRLRRLLIEDIRAAYEGDPAALTYAEVQLAYPGLLAVASHRLAHELYRLDVPIVPRVMSEWTHAKTGVDIHPGATVGHGFFIDHATGVVIGETAVIGNHVKIYQSVTLGAKSFPLDENGLPIKHVKRHPTVEDDVILYANSTILGDITIGAGSTVGGNVFLTEDVPADSFVYAKHAELHIKQSRERRRGGRTQKENSHGT